MAGSNNLDNGPPERKNKSVGSKRRFMIVILFIIITIFFVPPILLLLQDSTLIPRSSLHVDTTFLALRPLSNVDTINNNDFFVAVES